MNRTGIIVSLVVAAVVAAPACAHQPRIVSSPDAPLAIGEPEVSQAFYAELTGEPDTYLIGSTEPFNLYVGLSVPDIQGAETDFRFLVKSGDRTVAAYDGRGYDWTRFHEEFAGDDYLNGPEFRSRVPAGEYVITVSSPDDTGKYVLATGEREYFGFGDIIHALTVVPELKADYFGKPRASFALSIFGAVEIILSIAAGLAAGLIWRKSGKYVRRGNGATAPYGRKNLGLADRLVRVVLALVLAAVGIWFWRVSLMIAAGFVLYEALSAWCVLYSALGKNTCPVA